MYEVYTDHNLICQYNIHYLQCDSGSTAITANLPQITCPPVIYLGSYHAVSATSASSATPSSPLTPTASPLPHLHGLRLLCCLLRCVRRLCLASAAVVAEHRVLFARGGAVAHGSSFGVRGTVTMRLTESAVRRGKRWTGPNSRTSHRTRQGPGAEQTVDQTLDKTVERVGKPAPRCNLAGYKSS